jgi:F0F1-type ATP synthase assembly protein I
MKNKIKNSKEKLFKPSAVKDIAVGILYYNAASILGPILVFVGGGLLLDNYFNTKPYLTIGGLIIAFIISNILILKKINILTKDLKIYNEEKKNSETKELENKKTKETKEKTAE